MKKRYILNGKIYYEEDLTPFATESGMSFDDYLKESGATEHKDDNVYIYKDKEYKSDAMADFAKQSDMPYEDYLKEIGAKKKDFQTPSTDTSKGLQGTESASITSTTPQPPSEKTPSYNLKEDAKQRGLNDEESNKVVEEFGGLPEGWNNYVTTDIIGRTLDMKKTDPLGYRKALNDMYMQISLSKKEGKLQKKFNDIYLQNVEKPRIYVGIVDNKLPEDPNPDTNIVSYEKSIQDAASFIDNNLSGEEKEKALTKLYENQEIDNENRLSDELSVKNVLRHKLLGRDLEMNLSQDEKNKAILFGESTVENYNGKDVDNYTIESLELAADPNDKLAQSALKKYKIYKGLDKVSENQVRIDDIAVEFMADANGLGDLYRKSKENGMELPNVNQGELIDAFLRDPIVIEKATNDPNFRKLYERAAGELDINYPDYAEKKVATIISQAREDRGYNNPLVNIATEAATDELVDELINKGELTEAQKKIYQQKIRPTLGVAQTMFRTSLLGRLILGEAKIKTPDLVSGLSEGGYSGFKGGIGGIVDIVTAPMDLGTELLGSDSEINKAKERYRLTELLDNLAKNTQTTVINANAVNAGFEAAGNFTGFGAILMAGGAALGGAGLTSATAHQIGSGLVFYGINSERAKVEFPDDPLKRNAYAAVSTALDMNISKILPYDKIRQTFSSAASKDIKIIINDLAANRISLTAAKTRFDKVAIDFVKKGLGENTKMASVLTVLGQAHKQIDAIFGVKNAQNTGDAIEVIKEFKSSFLSGSILSAIGAVGQTRGSNKLIANNLLEMSNMPETYRAEIEKQMQLHPEKRDQLAEQLSNLNALVKIKEGIQGSKLSQAQMELYIVNAIQSKVFTDMALKSTDPNVAQEYEAKAQQKKKDNEKIYNGQDDAKDYESFTPLEEPKSEKAIYRIGEKDVTRQEFLDFLKTKEAIEGDVELYTEGDDLAMSELESIGGEAEYVDVNIAKQSLIGLSPESKLKTVTMDGKSIQLEGNEQKVAEAYADAKNNGTNPELVSQVESILGVPETKKEIDDKENKPRVSGEVGVGEEPVQAEPVEGAGGETTAAGGVLQAPEPGGKGKAAGKKEEVVGEAMPSQIAGYEVVEEMETLPSGEKVFKVIDENGEERFLTADSKELKTAKAKVKIEEKEPKPKEILNNSISVSSKEGRKGLASMEDIEGFVGEDRLGSAAQPNSRQIIDDLKRDIQENGFKEPIIIVYDKSKGEASIVEGNHRYAAAKELGLTEIPVEFEKGTLRSNEERAKDNMFPLNRKQVGSIEGAVTGEKLGIKLRQPETKDFVKGEKKAELPKQEGAKPTEAVPDIETKKADIERRRQEELNKGISAFNSAKTLESLQKAVKDWVDADITSPAGASINVRGALQTPGGFEKGKELILEEQKMVINSVNKQINAKYDAELAALEKSKPTEAKAELPKQEGAKPTVKPETKAEPTKATAKESTPQLGDSVEIDSLTPGGKKTKMVYTEKGWKIQDGTTKISASASQQERAQKKFDSENEVTEPKEDILEEQPVYVRNANVLITPATVRNFDSLTAKIQELSLKYDALVKDMLENPTKKKAKKLEELSRAILDAARQEIVDAASKIKGLEVKFGKDFTGLWDGKFEPSLNVEIKLSADVDTQAASDFLNEFAEKYSQDAFIVELNSEMGNAAIKKGNILLTYSDGTYTHYPQAVVNFVKPLTAKERAKLSNSLKEKGITAYSLNDNSLKVSIFTEIPEEVLNKFPKEKRKEQENKLKQKEYEAQKKNIRASLFESVGGTKELDFGIEHKKSIYRGGEKTGEGEQQRKYDRSDFLKPVSEEVKKAQELAKEAATLRNKEIKLQEQGKQLTPAEKKRLDELSEKVLPVIEETIAGKKSQYEEAKKELESIADKVMSGISGFVSKFPIKRPSRASVKVFRWYSGITEKLGDAVRANIIVPSEKEANYVFNKINKEYKGESPDLRAINDPTDLGYPKRLIEVRLSNGTIGEMQVMTPEGYLAKDGVSGFTENQQVAKETLAKVRERLGWDIPDGVGHYLYEIERDSNVPDNLRAKAKELSNKYYDAFLDPKSKLSDAEFKKDISEFKKEVDAADKSTWDKGNEGKSPETLNEYLGKEAVPEKSKDVSKLASNIRALKVDLSKLSGGGAQSNIAGLPIALYNTVIESIAKAVEGGTYLSKAIKDAIAKYNLKDEKDFKLEEFAGKVSSVLSQEQIKSNPSFFENAKEFASKSSYKNKLEFKKALQDNFKNNLSELKKIYGKDFDPSKLDEKTKKYLTDTIKAEAVNAINQHPEAIGWYDEITSAALDVMSIMHPEIATDAEARGAFILPLAVMSNGNKVDFNFALANSQYEYFKQNGRYNPEGGFGNQQAAIKKSLKLINSLLDSGLTMADLNTFLTNKYRAGDLKVKVNGKVKDFASGELADEKVFGATILGPKIGNGFYMNLWGEFEQLTMDRWFMRTFGRLTGTLVKVDKQQIKESESRLKQAYDEVKANPEANKILKEVLGGTSGMSAKSLATALQKKSMDKKLREKLESNEFTSELRKAGNNLANKITGEKEAPQNGSERKFIRDVFNDVQKRLKEEDGIDITMSDLQAVLWYPEKILYESFKEGESFDLASEGYGEDSAPDYLNSAKKLVKQKGITDEQINKTLSERGRDTESGFRKRDTGAGESAVGDNKAILETVQRAIGEPIVPKVKKTSKEVANTVRKGKIKLGDGGLQSNIAGVPIALYNTVVEAVALSIEGGMAIKDAVTKAIREYKLRDIKGFNKEEFVSKFSDAVGEEITVEENPFELVPKTQAARDKYFEDTFGDQADKAKEVYNKYKESGDVDLMMQEMSGGEGVPPTINKGNKISGDADAVRGITMAANAERRKDFGMGERQPNPESFEEWDAQAEQLVKDGYDMEALIKRMEQGIPSTPVENSIKKIYQATLDAQIKENPTNELLAKAKRFIKATEVSSSQAGKNLVSLKGNSEPLSSITDFYVAKMEANGVSELTEAQKKEVQKHFDMVDSANKIYEKKLAEAEAKNAELLAQNELLKKQAESKTTQKAATGGKRDFKAERESIKEKLRKEVENYKASMNKMGISSDGGAEGFAISVKMAKLILDLAKNHVEEVGAKLSEVTAKTFEDVKDIFPGITNKDIHDVIAGKYSEKKQTKNQIAADLRDLRTEAQLLNELDRVLAEEPKTEKEKIKKNQRLEMLRNQIKILKKQLKLDEYSDEARAAKAEAAAEENIKELERKLDENDIEVKKAEKINSPKLEALRERQKELNDELKQRRKEAEAPATPKDLDEARIKRTIEANKKKQAQLEKKLADKDFETEEKPESVYDNAEFKRKYPDLHKELMDSYRAKQDALHEYELAVLEDQMKNRNVAQKTFDFAEAAINTTKKIVTGIDDSALFMQTLVGMVVRPVVGGKAFAAHLRDLVSKRAFERSLDELHNSKWWDLIEKSGLDISEPQSLLEAKKEEAFSGRTLDINFKIKGKEYGIVKELTAPFERAFTSLGNNMRAISFMTLAEKYMQEGHTFENNPKLFKDLATMLNTETGRGKINEKAQMINSVLTKGIWSPKLMASRLNILGISDLVGLGTFYKIGTKGYYKELSPEIRKQALYDLGKFVTAVAAISYSFAYAFGGEVDDDPRSQTYLDIKVGNKSYNFAGGFSQYIRLIAQTGWGGKTIDGKFKSFEDQRKDRGSNILHFLRGKVTPVTGVAIDVTTGKDFMGQPITVESEVKKLSIPLSMQSLSSSMERDGSLGLLTTTLPSFVGIGVKDERDFEKGDKFTGDEKRNTSLKRLAEYNVDIPKLQTREQVKIKVDKNHKEAGKYKDGSPYALYSETEFKEYNTMRKDLIIGALDKLFLNLDKKQIQLDQKSLYDALEDIKKKATVLSRMKVLGETEEQEKEDNEIDIEEIISDYFEDKTP